MHQLMTGDFDGDARADIIGRSGGVLQVWLSASTPAQWAFPVLCRADPPPGGITES